MITILFREVFKSGNANADYFFAIDRRDKRAVELAIFFIRDGDQIGAYLVANAHNSPPSTEIVSPAT